MRLFTLGLLLSLASAASAGAKVLPKPTSAETILVNFYTRHGLGVPTKTLHSVAGLTTKWALRAGIPDQVPILLSMAHRETHMTPGLVCDHGRSVGVYQVNKADNSGYRAWWRSKGFTIDKGLDTEVAYGVAAYWRKLQYARGDVFTAVRMYNGVGPDARKHAMKVLRSRKNIFGIGHKVGEKALLYSSKSHGPSKAHNKKKRRKK